MHKNTAFKILNPILAVLAVSQALSALLNEQLSRKTFVWVHEGGGTLLLIGVGLHVVLNWSWIRVNLLPRKRP